MYQARSPSASTLIHLGILWAWKNMCWDRIKACSVEESPWQSWICPLACTASPRPFPALCRSPELLENTMCWSLIRSQGTSSASWGTLSWRKQQEQEAWGLVPVGCEQFQPPDHKLGCTGREWLGECVAKGRGVLGLPLQPESFVESLKAFGAVESAASAL